MTLSTTLASKLKALMPERGLDQAELARRSGIKANSISRYLAGLNMPRPAHLAKLAAALEVEVRDLLAEEPAAEPATAANLLCLTQTSANSGMVRLQVDQMLPGELATQIVALLLQAPPQASEPEEEASTTVRELRKPGTVRAKPQQPPRRGTLADILLPQPTQEPEHARQVLRLDGPPQRPLNGVHA
jgi:transcriptional regulator with XRE-family HTH domain